MKIYKVLAFMVATMVAVPAFGGPMLFEIGDEGGCCGTNVWPGGEAPEFAIDGFAQKYLNFAADYTGVAITPASGASVAESITLWTANDSAGRDPASFSVFGKSGAVGGGPGDIIGGLTLIASDVIALPANRSGEDVAPLFPANSATAFFSNSDAYDSYVIVFPTLKGDPIMQVAEIQLNVASGAPIFAPVDVIRGGQMVVPEPSACLLALFGSVLLGCRIRS